jgi:FkbM family methyltransferase
MQDVWGKGTFTGMGGVSLPREGWRRILYQMTMFSFHAVRGTNIAKCMPLRSLWKRLFDFSRPHGMVLREIHGSRMYLDSDDPGVGLSVLMGIFESFETDLFTRCIRESMTVVDVGANIGYYSLLAAQRVGKSGRVFAIEPNPAIYQMLLQNIAINDYHTIIPINRCVSEFSGKARFHVNRDLPGESNMLPCTAAEREDTITVDTLTLDDLLPDCEVDVLKMDIEGAEGLALMGASRLLRNRRPLIFMEFVPTLLTNMGTPPTDVLRIIRDYGYSLYVINEKSGTLQTVADDDAASLGGYLFCIPPDKGRDLLLQLSERKLGE